MIETSVTVNGRVCYPNFSAGITLQSKLQTGERFRRTELGEDFVFQGDDFAWIVAQPFDTKFILTFTCGEFVWNGVFWKTDCEFDADKHTCRVTPAPYDYYKAVLDGMEKEYDLVRLAPASEKLTLHKRNILQVYATSDGVGDRVLTNFVGTTSWEQDIQVAYSEVTESMLIDDYKFAKVASRFAYRINSDYAYGNYNDVYVGEKWESLSYGDDPLVFDGSGQSLRLRLWVERESNGSTFTYYLAAALYYYDVAAEVPGSKARSIGQSGSTFYYDRQGYASFKIIRLGFPETSARSLGESCIYSRVISGQQLTGAWTKLPADDIIPANLNYTWVNPLGGSVEGDFVISAATRRDPTEWGQDSFGNYFVSPGDDYIPISRSLWKPFSLWVSKLRADGSSSPTLSESYTLNDAYPLEAAINVLLDEITGDSGLPVTFSLTDSLFLNNGSPLRSGRKLFIAQLSNVKKTYYQNAAQTGKITLRQIFDMLRDCFHAYWHIDTEGHLHIEHVSWYMYGGSYTKADREAAVDLTSVYHPRNLKPWSFGQDKYGFAKTELPERTELSFASSQSAPFNGLPIQYRSGYVTKGQIEKVSIANFYSDVDWLISGASGTGDEGWVVLDAAPVDGVYRVPFITGDLIDGYYVLQNGYMSFEYLESHYFGYDMSAPQAVYQGGYAMTCHDTVRARTQTVTFPCTGALNDYDLVQTGIGYGEITSIEYNLFSTSAKAELKLPTEDE